jgi:hypothetical protein
MKSALPDCFRELAFNVSWNLGPLQSCICTRFVSCMLARNSHYCIAASNFGRRTLMFMLGARLIEPDINVSSNTHKRQTSMPPVGFFFFFNGSTAPWGPRQPHFTTLHDHTR